MEREKIRELQRLLTKNLNVGYTLKRGKRDGELGGDQHCKNLVSESWNPTENLASENMKIWPQGVPSRQASPLCGKVGRI